MANGFSARQIKIIACISMLFSHTGFIFWPSQLWWQIPGRLAMPIFAYMIANGARYSRNVLAYVARLLIFAALIQYPYSIFLASRHLNICFTLGLGLTAIMVWQGTLSRGWRILTLAALAVAAELLNTEYGLYGILMIFTAHLFFTDRRKLAISWIILNVPYLWQGMQGLRSGAAYPQIQGLCLLALPVLLLYNGRRGGGRRWEFYIFYIGHLAILYCLRLLLWGY